MAERYSPSAQAPQGGVDAVTTRELNENLLRHLQGPKKDFDEWRGPRPMLGGGALLIAGLITAYIPMLISSEVLFVGGSYTVIGLVFATGIFVSGVGALLEPTHARLFGVLGIAFSFLSLFGALGGFLIGMMLGVVGGNLCFAWTGPDGDAADGVDTESNADTAESTVEPDTAESTNDPGETVNFRLVE